MSKVIDKNKPGKMTEKNNSKKSLRGVEKRSRSYHRFHWSQRIAHILLLTSFSTLGITGLPQKYSLSSWGQFLISVFGGIELTRGIHHFAAVVLMLLSIYHLVDISYKIFVKRVQLSMLPGFKDVKDALQAFGYNLGLVKRRPQMGRYTFEEKMEYWALLWGTLIMGFTGFLMWNPIASTRIFPGELIPAAKNAHGGEAILAVAAIILWHMYGVHIKRFNKSMFTGRISEEEMLHEHPLELADIKAGISERSINPTILHRRQKIFWPIAIVCCLIMLIGVYGFIGVENTAVTSNPSVELTIPVYVPSTPLPEQVKTPLP